MSAKHKMQYIFGGALILVLCGFILSVFSLLSRTDKKDLYLMDTSDERFGWRYELLADGQVRDYEPVFEEKYMLSLPVGTQAVRMSRTMTEPFPTAELEWMSFQDGVEVFLDDMLLYTDFPQLDRDAQGFVYPGQEQWDQLKMRQGRIWRQIRMSLPEEYLGGELTMVTYFPEDTEGATPEYPFLGNEDTRIASYIVLPVKYNAVMTVYALLALLMAGLFLLDIHNNSADAKTLLLCLYFLLLFLTTGYGSEAGYYSVLSSYIDLELLRELYIVPLYFYLALRLTTQWKWPICGGITAWTLYESVRSFLEIRRGDAATASTIGPGGLVILLALAAAFCAEGLQRGRLSRAAKKRLIHYGLLFLAVTAAYLFSRARMWVGLGSYLRDGVWLALTMGNFGPVVSLCSTILSYTMVIMVVTETVLRTVRATKTMSVLQERGRLTMDGYERVLRAEEATNAANHEMRHHMTALAGLLHDGDTERAKQYISEVTDALDRLPTVRYCANVLINAVAGAYLDKAKAEGIRVECNMKVPKDLRIADRDISVFLTNMLENALHACRQLDPSQDRYIRLKMVAQENFLFIGCANSAPEEQEAEDLNMEARAIRSHGYGLEAMRQIAEKYSSMLLLEQKDGEFSVKSNFNLLSATTSPSAGPRGQ